MEVPGAVRRGIRFANNLSTGRAALLLVLGIGLPSAPTLAQTDSENVVIRAVSLRQVAGGAEIEIEADETPRWTIRYDKSGGFVLRMPGSVIGREIPDLEAAEGPIAEVRLQQVADPAAPYTLLSVVARERVRVSVRPAGASLKILLDPLSTTQPATAEATPELEEPPTDVPEAPIEQPEPLALPTPPAPREVAADPELPADPGLQEELELLRAERDALALGNPAYAVAGRARPCLYLRSAPDGRELDCVDPGTRLTVLGLEGAWARVRVDDRLDAWARFEYLEPAPALPSSPGEKGLQERLAKLGSELSGVRQENLELREAAATAQESLERAWEAQQILSARLVEVQAGGADATAERERLAETVESLRSENADLTTAIERLREETSAAERQAAEQLQAATAERDALARLLDESRNAMALGGSTFVVLPTARPCLNLRSEPGAATRLDCLPPGTRIALLELRGEWARARAAEGADGWLAHAFVEPAPATPDEVRQLDEARRRITALESAAQSERAAIEGRLADAEAETTRLRAELDAARAAATDQAAESAGALESLRTELAESSSAHEASDTRATELAASLERASAEIESLRARLVDAAADLEAAHERTAAAETDAEALRTRLDESSTAHETAGRRAADLAARLETATAASTAGSQRIAQLEADLEAARARLAETATEAAATGERTTAAENEIASLRAQLADADDELAATRSASSERQAVVEAELSALRDRAARSDTAIAAAQQHVAELERQLEAAHATAGRSRTEAEAEIAALRERADRVEAAVVAAQERSTELEEQVEEWKVKAAEAESMVSAAIARSVSSAELETRLAAAEAESDSLRIALEQERAARADAEARSKAAQDAMALGSSTYVVRGDVDPCLNLRAQPGDGAPIDCLAPATRLTLLEASTDWARARLDSGAEGWLSRSFIEPAPSPAAEIETLRAELAELEASAATASALAAQAETRGQVLTSRLEDERAERARLEGELQTALARSAVARSESDNVLDDARRELEASRAEVARLTSELEGARERAAAESRVAELSDRDAAEPPSQVDPEPEIAPPSAPAPDTDSIEARALALEWARAWSDQRVDDYLACYADRFEAPGGLTRAEWAAQRRQRLGAPSFIEVGLTDIETRAGADGEIDVEFTQSYRSNTYSDRVRKSLTLTREGGGWKILREISR